MVVKNKIVQKPENMEFFSNLYKMKKEDIKKAASKLADAFSGDPMLIKIFDNEDKIRAMYEMMTRFSFRYGNVVSTSDNLEGIMATFSPNKEMTLWRIIRSGAFFLSMKLTSIFKKMAQIDKVIKEGKKELNLGSYIYLFIIGVPQEFQGKGYGGKLLRDVIEKAELEGKSIYLETQNEKNVSLYEKYGFSVRKKLILPVLNLPMWLMVRDPKGGK